jgi:quercetin dioxygenase-like cupin family protein
MNRLALGVLLGVAAAGCGGGAPRLLGEGGVVPAVAWTAEELAKTGAIRTLRATHEASFHVLRLDGAEQAHVHDRNDLTVVVLSGGGTLHLGEAALAVRPGDVLTIPRGATHWLDSGGAPTQVYLICTPPMGKDFRRDVR